MLGAAPSLGGSLAGLEAAEAEGLVSLEAGRIAFSHPLVRSAVLARAAPADCRAAHRAYAGRLDPDADAERRAWHVAAGTLQADEGVAASLAAAAVSAGGRGGHAAAAAAFEQAAHLSPEPPRRAERLRRAADAAWLAGDGPRALALLDEAAPIAVTATERAEAGHLRGRVLARRGPVPLAISVLQEAAEAIAGEQPAKAAEILAEAAYAALHGPSAVEDMDRIARRAAELAPPDDPRARCLAAIALGAALVLGGRPGAADRLAEAAALIDSMPDLRDDVRLAALLGVPPTFMRVERAGYRPLVRAVALARERGAVGVLPFALFYLGMGALGSPRWAEAGAHFEEGLRLAGETGLRVDAVTSLVGLARLGARRGDAAATEHARTALGLAREFGMPYFEAVALHAQGDVAWARGDLAGAVTAFEAKAHVLEEHGLRDPDLSPAPELVEALVRLGRADEAGALATRVAADAAVKGRPWALARARRVDGLVCEDEAGALEHYASAIALHAPRGGRVRARPHRAVPRRTAAPGCPPRRRPPAVAGRPRHVRRARRGSVG